MNNEQEKNGSKMQDAACDEDRKHRPRQAAFPRQVEITNLIYRFGGTKKIARICKVSVTSVYHWRTHVSAEAAWNLLAYAKRNNMPLLLKDIRPDLDFGLSRNDVEELP